MSSRRFGMLPRARDREGRAAELVIIGDGFLRRELEAAIARNSPEKNVHLLGWADSATIRRTLDESCAFVLPSFAEGLPVVIMEAMARARASARTRGILLRLGVLAPLVGALQPNPQRMRKQAQGKRQIVHQIALGQPPGILNHTVYPFDPHPAHPSRRALQIPGDEAEADPYAHHPRVW